MELAGTILRGPDFEPIEGRIVIEDGRIEAIEEATNVPDRIVSPAFVNAHTHLGDSIAKEAGRGLSLAELVAPPDGLKHRLLREADRDEMVHAMKRSLEFALATGTVACLDFREGGVEGVSRLEEAASDLPIDAYAFGRESVEAMEAGDGFGASGANDADFERERRATAAADKPFGIHAGEADPSDLDPALDLSPEFLVHVVHPEPRHLERIESDAIPIAVCPRSNLVTGVGVPPVDELARRTTVALGTDNVMLNSPSMFREMEFLAKHTALVAPAILRMATRNGADLLGRDDGLIEQGRPANLLVLDADTPNLAGVLDPVRAVVRRAGQGDVADVIVDGRSVEMSDW
ncbi:amidohydrolase [Halovivax asiaticus JCM 14624]|uniref:Amidohydrolase n=1 Tax=Halovivax asiaticus JCM 14624 TaxID=1227490 RepID=M0BR39_9EURY|nr:amidohydrolase family protein [Halovivax asiaticus]ELZ13410.1 amidohydrolase [Halovivax asiaticus JCM 14624]